MLFPIGVDYVNKFCVCWIQAYSFVRVLKERPSRVHPCKESKHR